MKLTDKVEVTKLIRETEFILNDEEIDEKYNTEFKSILLELNICLLKLKIYLLEVELGK